MNHRKKMENLVRIVWIFNILLGQTFSDISLAPSTLEVVRYVNESYIVTCMESDKKSVTWARHRPEGERVLGDKGHPHTMMMSKGTALVFERITPADRGTYSCHSGDETRSFKLFVISPILFINTPSEQTAQEHHPATLKCEVSGDPLPKVVWKFYEKTLKPPKYSISKDGLKIANVTLEDRGTYTCRAYQVSQVTSMFEEKSIRLNVQHKPIHKKPVRAKVDQAYGYMGGTVNLTCEAVAEPAAKFTWYRQHNKSIAGRIINDSSKQPHWSVLQLFIKNGSEFGDYLCQATNKLGTLDQIITLQEGTKPAKPRELRLKGSNSDTLTFDIIGPEHDSSEPDHMHPIGYRLQYKPKDMKIKWSEAGVADFEGDDAEIYIITGLSHNTEYEIRVATRNLAGLSEYTSPSVFKTMQLQADQVTAGGSCLKTLYVQSLFGAVIFSIIFS